MGSCGSERWVDWLVSMGKGSKHSARGCLLRCTEPSARWLLMQTAGCGLGRRAGFFSIVTDTFAQRQAGSGARARWVRRLFGRSAAECGFGHAATFYSLRTHPRRTSCFQSRCEICEVSPTTVKGSYGSRMEERLSFRVMVASKLDIPWRMRPSCMRLLTVQSTLAMDTTYSSFMRVSFVVLPTRVLASSFQ